MPASIGGPMPSAKLPSAATTMTPDSLRAELAHSSRGSLPHAAPTDRTDHGCRDCRTALARVTPAAQWVAGTIGEKAATA